MALAVVAFSDLRNTVQPCPGLGWGGGSRDPITSPPTDWPPLIVCHLCLDDNKPPIQMPGSSEYDASGGVQDPAAAGPRGPGPHEQIPPNKPPWFDQPHPVAPWGQQQVSVGEYAWLSKRPALCEPGGQ